MLAAAGSTRAPDPKASPAVLACWRGADAWIQLRSVRQGDPASGVVVGRCQVAETRTDAAINPIDKGVQ